MRELPADYLERVYAGVLGKLIGVYLGRPFEGWTYQRIMRARADRILRARAPRRAAGRHRRRRRRHLHLHPRARGLRRHAPTSSPRKSARPGSTTSSRSARSSGGAATAIRPSIPPGSTSSAAIAGAAFAVRSRPTARAVAEQIGAQIFIDGWAMVAPGQPQARRAPRRTGGAASAMTASRSTPRCCGRRWRRRPSSPPTSTI